MHPCTVYITDTERKDYVTCLQRNALSSLIAVSANLLLILYVEENEQKVKTRLFLIRGLRNKDKCTIEI